jgi:hypothetical protein
MWYTVIFIIVGVFSRLLPHPPNFSPLVAVALFSGVYWNRKYGYLLPLGTYVISDLIIGLHNTVIFTWSSILLIYFIGTRLKRGNIGSTVIYTLFSSFLFFIITNFGVWLLGWYPHTLRGLIECYILALPFFRTSLLADILFVGILFGTYEYFLSRRLLAQKIH